MKAFHQIALGLMFQHGHVGPSLLPLLQSPSPAAEPAGTPAAPRVPLTCCDSLAACCG